ncbi:hypothetical protein [Paenisporosarcina sp. NPDC076898]|uniref:hypothetical protein n=1 Tax=unclassified Paenisporosarcina TaxID=2642018 RepID=UPI003D00A7FA
MKPVYVDQKEMELRQNQDFNASLNMVAEGSPIYHLDNQETDAEKEDKQSF